MGGLGGWRQKCWQAGEGLAGPPLEEPMQGRWMQARVGSGTQPTARNQGARGELCNALDSSARHLLLLGRLTSSHSEHGARSTGVEAGAIPATIGFGTPAP